MVERSDCRRVFNAIKGRLKFKFAHAVITPALVAHDLQGVAHFSPAELALDDLDGSLAGGHVTGALAFRRGPDGLGAHAQLELAAANAAALLQPSLNVADGAMTMALICDGLGNTPGRLDRLVPWHHRGDLGGGVVRRTGPGGV